MRSRVITLLIGILIVFSFIQTTSAHVPLFMEGGHSIDDAVSIENPTKSWVIYSLIHEADEPHYFYLNMQAGEHIRIMLMVPILDGNLGFRPRLALMGDGLTNMSTPPTSLEIPEGAGVMILESATIHPEYEGFTPTSFAQLLTFDIPAPTTGRYYLAYYEPTMPGHFAIAIGYQETFTFTEWITIPFTVITTHLWNHQSPLALLTPILLTVLLGIALLSWRRPPLRSQKQLLTWAGIFSALLFIASGIFIFYQMLLALLQVPLNPQILITFTFGALPILLGLLVLHRLIFRDWQHHPRQLALLLILAVLALFLWAGWIIGPLILIIVIVIPTLQILLARRTPNLSQP